MFDKLKSWFRKPEPRQYEKPKEACKHEVIDCDTNLCPDCGYFYYAGCVKRDPVLIEGRSQQERIYQEYFYEAMRNAAAQAQFNSYRFNQQTSSNYKQDEMYSRGASNPLGGLF